MQRMQLAGSDLEVSRFCLGSAHLGPAEMGETIDRLFGAFRDAGGNFFDTAHCYAFWRNGCEGGSERAIGDYFRRNGGRDKCIVATKGGHPGVANYRKVDWYMSPGRVSADIDDSLARLDCDRLDLFYLHRDDPRMTVGEIIDYLNAEIDRGRVRAIGASNWTASRLADANAYAVARGLRGFVASEPEWSLVHRTAPPTMALHFFDAADADWHRKSKLPVIPYASTGRGYFASGGQRYDEAKNEVSAARLARVQKLAGELGCTSGQLALAWLMNQEFPVIPILGTGNVEHLREDLAAEGVRLTSRQVSWLAGCSEQV